ncbi:DNA ligase [Gayadomonas joobiniege]|uniref:DNA ligase n=1 Tax=Gayadomonas joobiniege TaxID=1234606 RepID=UPI00035C35C7|nr:DNA ligase [Gayadomonas joobiniege]
MLAKQQLQKTFWLVLLILFICPVHSVISAELMQADDYRANVAVTEYYASEKLDGIRAYWDGQHLISKSGRQLKAPPYFTDSFPSYPLDGELWAGRNSFEQTLSIVQSNDKKNWQSLRLMVFDLPAYPAPFADRVQQMEHLQKQLNHPYIEFIPQQLVRSEAALKAQLKSVLEQGGEGLMLHHKAANYPGQKGVDLLKLKPQYQSVATVIQINEGQGRFTGLMGSLTLKTSNGQTFKLASGFTIAEREKKFKVGDRIRYRFSGYTGKGLPRHAVYIRIEKPNGSNK